VVRECWKGTGEWEAEAFEGFYEHGASEQFARLGRRSITLYTIVRWSLMRTGPCRPHFPRSRVRQCNSVLITFAHQLSSYA